MKRISKCIENKKEKYNANKIAGIFLPSILKLGLAIALSFTFLLIFSTFVLAEGWSPSKPSHGTLFADTITSKTDGSPVNVADSLFVVEGITTLGNVGIGTTAPTTPWGKVLQVNDANNGGFALSSVSGGNIWYMTTDSAGDLHFSDSASGYTRRLYIKNNGNVGIGTTEPDSQLHATGKAHINNVFVGGTPVGGMPDYSIYTDSVVGSGNLHLSSRTGGNLYLNTQSGSGNVFIVPAGGNVGIGTTNPNSKLTIEGGAPVAEIRSGGYLMIRPTANDFDMRIGSGSLGSNMYMGFFSGFDLVNPRMVVTAPGNVGIGTNTVDQALDVYKSGQGTSAIKIKSDQYSGWPGRGELGSLLFGVDGGGSGAPVIGEIQSMAQGDGGYSLLFRAYGSSLTDVMSILGSGNVGIGTTTPGAKLDAAGHISLGSASVNAPELQFRGSAVHAKIIMDEISATDGQLWFQTQDAGTLATRMTILDNGNVGIGTTNPTAKLHVNGNIANNGIVTFANGDTTPDVSGGNVFLTANTGATTITDFEGEAVGQVIIIICGDAVTTISRAQSLLLNSQPFGCALNSVITLVKGTVYWHEVSRSTPNG